MRKDSFSFRVRAVGARLALVRLAQDRFLFQSIGFSICLVSWLDLVTSYLCERLTGSGENQKEENPKRLVHCLPAPRTQNC
jgi:hypothetical protein